MPGVNGGQASSPVKEEPPPLLLSWRKFSRFEQFTFGPGLSVSAFLGEWEDRLGIAMEAGCLYSDMVLAFKLLTRLNVSEETVEEILGEVDPGDSQDSLVSQVASLLQLRLGEEGPDHQNPSQATGRPSRLEIESEFYQLNLKLLFR
jgi:hypothetical protein